LILMFIWGATGYCFAERYISIKTWWGCALFSLVFILIVIQIERQVILTVGRNRGIVIFRFILAVLMALIGSSILDQIIFKNDVEKVLVELRTDQANIIAQKRQKTIQIEINTLSSTIDSLENINRKLNEEVARQPTIAVTNVTREVVPVTLANGTKSTETKSTTSTQHIANTRIDQIRSNASTIQFCRTRLEKLNNLKINIEDIVRKELKAMIKIIKSDFVAAAFYFLLFAFIISLELLVVMSKIGDNKCDYDLIVEYQVGVKKAALDDMIKK